jgi:hypothetical protein
MRRRTIELGVGLGLLLGPLGYALTLEPEVVEVVHEVEVVVTPPASAEPVTVERVDAPTTEPAPVAPAPVAPAPAPSLEGRLPFVFVNEAGLVLHTAADPAWGTGRLLAHAGPGEYRAAKRVDVAKLPDALWAQRGRTFDVYGASGKLCTARLGELSVLAQHNGPSLFEVFNGSMDTIEWGSEDEDPTAAFERQTHTRKQIRAKVWSSTTLGDDSVWLVAELVSDRSCEGGLWARDAELPPPAVLHRAEGPLPITLQRIAAHAASDTLAAAKLAYEEWRNGFPADERPTLLWSTIEEEHPASATAWIDEGGTPRLVELDFGYTEDGCGDFPETRISSVDRVVDGEFEPTTHAIAPVAVFDVDLDGRYELLYDTSLASDTPALAEAWILFEEFYCPC